MSSFISSDLVESAINHDRGILPPIPKFRYRYYLALDPAKGNRDKYTACISHYDNGVLIVDLWHEFQPTWNDGNKKQVNIAEVEDWILMQHQSYGFAQAVLDQYNSAASIQRLSSKLKIKELTWSSPSKTEGFSKIRELFNSEKIELYPHPKANQQIKNLTVTYRPSGLWSVSGGTGAAVDDYPSALAGIALIASNTPRFTTTCLLPSTPSTSSIAAIRAKFDPNYQKEYREKLRKNPWYGM